jgi:hypothetical protein
MVKKRTITKKSAAPADPDLSPDSTPTAADPDQAPATNNEQRTTINAPKLTGRDLHDNLTKCRFIADQVKTINDQRSTINASLLDITEDPTDYYKIIHCLSTLGDDGRAILHQVAMYNPNYNQADTDAAFTDALAISKFSSPRGFYTVAGKYDLITKMPVTKPGTEAGPNGESKKVKAKKVFELENFWRHYTDPETEKTEIIIIRNMFLKFLHQGGYGLLPMDEGLNFQYIHVEENIVKPVNEFVIKTYTLDRLEEKPEYEPIYEKMLIGTKQYFTEALLNRLPFFADLNFIKDTPGQACVFYENCYVLITADTVETRKYTDLTGNIYRSQKIPRPFTMLTDGSELMSDVSRFITIVATGKRIADIDYNGTADDELLIKLQSFKATTGYLLHNYKDPSLKKAVIGIDAKNNEDGEPEGGTGKNLYGDLVGAMVNVCHIDAQIFQPGDPKAYDRVNIDTRIISFDDADYKFPFKKIFPLITEGPILKRLYKDTVRMGYKESPKVYINTNYAFKGKSQSFRRRQHILEFADFFNDEVQPSDEFGHMLMDDWDAEEWNRYDNFMIHCLQTYLKDGLVPFPLQNFGTKQLRADVPTDFIDWAETLTINEYPPAGEWHRTEPAEYEKHAMFEEFIQYAHWKGPLQLNTFSKWLRTWCEFSQYIINPHKASSSTPYRDKRGKNEYVTIYKKDNAPAN